MSIPAIKVIKRSDIPPPVEITPYQQAMARVKCREAIDKLETYLALTEPKVIQELRSRIQTLLGQ